MLTPQEKDKLTRVLHMRMDEAKQILNSIPTNSLVDATTDNDGDIRELAVCGLGDREGENVEKVLIKAADDDKSPLVRSEAICVLGKRILKKKKCSKAVKEAIIRAKNDGHFLVRSMVELVIELARKVLER